MELRDASSPGTTSLPESDDPDPIVSTDENEVEENEVEEDKFEEDDDLVRIQKCEAIPVSLDYPCSNFPPLRRTSRIPSPRHRTTRPTAARTRMGPMT